MKLNSSITINGRTYQKGADIAWYQVYPFFLLHMLLFGLSGFVMSYSGQKPPLFFIYLHGGIAISVYITFYLAIFGRDDVKWMFINAGLGLLGIYSNINRLLSLFGKKVGDYPIYMHVTPFLYYILYTFLIRHAVLDLLSAREDEAKRRTVERYYIFVSMTVYGIFFILDKRAGW